MLIFALLLSSISVVHADSATAVGWQLSPNYDHVRSHLAELARQNPDRARLFDLGVADSGRTIQGLALGDGPVKTLVVGTHHGNEYGSTEVAKAVASSLAEQPLSGMTVYVVPVLNIEGFDQRSRTERGNDPNRDYPGPCGTDGPFHLKSTRALADFIAREKVVTAVTMHTFTPVVAYPWGVSTRDTHTIHHMIFEELAQQAVIESKYPTGTSTETIYPADGTFEDYAYWELGVWSFLFELGRNHRPSYDDVVEMIRVNVPGIRRMLAAAPRERAESHGFTVQCDYRLKGLDRRDE